MTADFLEQFTEHVTDYLRQGLTKCKETGMEPPFIICAASPNGSVLCLRTDGTEPQFLASTIRW
jgi:hypothetical protein